MLESSARRVPSRAAVVAVALALLLSGCADEKKKTTPAPEPTPLANLDTTAMGVSRIEFCGLVPDAAVSAALGGKPEEDASYGNGDEEELPGVGTEVVHEIGCSWTGSESVTARAWVFARPISPSFARTVIAAGRKTAGCRTAPGPGFGDPSGTQVCRFADGEHRVRHAGLFGQTWLTCELAANDADIEGLRTRTDRWCVEVASALDTAG